MGLVANFENVVLVYDSESCESRLKIVKGVTHVAVGSEDQCFVTILGDFDVFLGCHYLQSLDYLLVI